MNLNDLPKLKEPDKDTQYQFQNKAVNPSGESKEYYLKEVKASYYYNYTNAGVGYLTNARRLEFIQNRLIATGRDDMRTLITKIKGKYEDGKDVSYTNLDWESLKLVSKFRSIVIGKLEELEWDMVATAINPEAGAEKEQIKWRLWAEAEEQAWTKMMEEISGAKLVEPTKMPDGSEPPIPIENKRDLELVMDKSFKHIYELAIELGINFVADDNRWVMLKKLLLEDAFDLGRFAVDVIQNPIDGRVEWRYVDIVNLVAPDFRGHYLDTPERIGYFYTTTIAQLMTECPEGQITPEQVQMLASRFSSKLGNPAFQSAANPIYNTDASFSNWLSFNVPIFKLYFEASDKVKSETKEREFDKKVKWADPMSPIGESKYNETRQTAGRPFVATKKVEATDIHFYHQVSWVVDTEIVFNYGKVPNQARKVSDSKKAVCPLKYYIIDHESMVDRMRAFNEAANLAWVKMQSAKADARPSGVSIDLSALANLAIDGKGMTSDVAVKIYNQSGNLFWASKNFLQPDNMVGYKPIQELPNGLQKDYADWLADIQFNINMMRDLIGLNQSTDASSQGERTLSGVAQLAVQGTQNALSQIVSALTFTTEQVADETAQKLQMLVRTGDIRVLENSIGTTAVKSIGSEILPHTFGIKLEARPTLEQRAELKEAAKSALINTSDPVKGGLNYDDYFEICDLINGKTNFKLAQLIFGYMVKRNLERQQALQQKTMESQAQANMQRDNALFEQKMKIMEVEHGYAKDLLYTEAEIEGAVLNSKAQEKFATNQQKAELKNQEITHKSIVDSKSIS